jgi:hypothetical protein
VIGLSEPLDTQPLARPLCAIALNRGSLQVSPKALHAAGMRRTLEREAVKTNS